MATQTYPARTISGKMNQLEDCGRGGEWGGVGGNGEQYTYNSVSFLLLLRFSPPSLLLVFSKFFVWQMNVCPKGRNVRAY